MIRGLKLPRTSWATSACRGTHLLYFLLLLLLLLLLKSLKLLFVLKSTYLFEVSFMFCAKKKLEVHVLEFVKRFINLFTNSSASRGEAKG